jgi:hypothetical protein
MDKKVAGLAGVLTVSSFAAAHAAVPAQTAVPAQAISRANAYAELLKPIPNAAEELKKADAATQAQASQRKAEAKVQLAQYWGGDGGYYYHHHHHHHHHHHGYYWQQPLYPPRYHHHHHHHHHWQGGGWGDQ